MSAISSQNYILPHLGSDIRPGRLPTIGRKVTMDADGNWIERDIHRIPLQQGEMELPISGPALAQRCLRERQVRVA